MAKDKELTPDATGTDRLDRLENIILQLAESVATLAGAAGRPQELKVVERDRMAILEDRVNRSQQRALAREKAEADQLAELMDGEAQFLVSTVVAVEGRPSRTIGTPRVVGGNGKSDDERRYHAEARYRKFNGIISQASPSGTKVEPASAEHISTVKGKIAELRREPAQTQTAS